MGPLNLSLAQLLSFGSGSQAMAEPKLTAKKYPIVSYGTENLEIDITNTGDTPVTIKGVSVNRGNCHSWTKLIPKNGFADLKTKPRQLKFGETFTQFAQIQCDVIEVSLDTDQGEITFTWQ
jgi:hypothetical protein